MMNPKINSASYPVRNRSAEPLRYTQNSLHNLREVINSPSIKVISFDIFDTLVCRPLLEPDDLFVIMEPQVCEIIKKKIDFKKIRKAADNAARAALQPGNDVTIDAIYEEIGKMIDIDRSTANRIKYLELNFEKKLLTKRTAVVHEMEHAFSIGKRVILASDMYLSRSYLRKTLHRLGINTFHDIYVSAEVGFRKDSHTLFPYIIEKEGVKPEEILHIGDNEYSDIKVAAETGIRVFHVRKTLDIFLETQLAQSVFINRLPSLSLYSRIAFAFGINKLFDNPYCNSASIVNGDPELFGYFYLAPLLLSFTKWIAETAVNEKIDQLLFLSRDGEILHKIYMMMEKYDLQKLPEADYIEISRQAIGGPFVNTIEDVHRILNTSYSGDTLKNFFNTRFGLDISHVKKEILNKFGYEDHNSRVYIPDDIEKIKPLAEYIYQSNSEILKRKRVNAIVYLKSKNLFNDTKKAIVDIGYSGSMQKYLNEIVGKPIHGLYMVTHKNIRENLQKPDIFTKGLFGDNIDPREKSLPIDKYSLFFEMVLSSVKGPVKEYKSKRLFKPVPIHEKVSWEESGKLRKLPLVHKGILDFCNDFLSRFGNIVDAVPYNDLNFLQEPFRHFHETPTLKDIIMLAGYSIDDYYCGHRILYWVPPISEIQNRNYMPGKFLWHQALVKLNTESAESINRQLQLHKERYPDLHHTFFDTPLDREIFDWYHNEFEKLPAWYKRINKIVQLANGTKRIKLVLEDKEKPRAFNSKAEEIQDWYNREYEKMPTWYKKGGHLIKIVTGKKKISEYTNKN